MQSRFGHNALKFQVVRAQNGTAALKTFHRSENTRLKKSATRTSVERLVVACVCAFIEALAGPLLWHPLMPNVRVFRGLNCTAVSCGILCAAEFACTRQSQA